MRLEEVGHGWIKRSGDGSCLFWSGGTVAGDYDVDSFRLRRAGSHMHSPITCKDMYPAAMTLYNTMMADRAAVADWCCDPANAQRVRAAVRVQHVDAPQLDEGAEWPGVPKCVDVKAWQID